MREFGKGVMSKAGEQAKKFGQALDANSALGSSVARRTNRVMELSNINDKAEKLAGMKDAAGEVLEGSKKAYDRLSKRSASNAKVYGKIYKSDAAEDLVKIRKAGGNLEDMVEGAKQANKAMKDTNLGEKWKVMKDSGMYSGKTEMLGSAISNYYAGPDVNYLGKGYKDGLARAGATAGAYAGVNAVARGISGGSMTRNKDGERDIAGIPFV